VSFSLNILIYDQTRDIEKYKKEYRINLPANCAIQREISTSVSLPTGQYSFIASSAKYGSDSFVFIVL
jgi:hypothetical protein